MQNRFLTLCIIVLAVSNPIAAAAAASSSTAPAVETKSPAENLPVIEVDALMKAPDKYQGTVRVRGVVSSVFPKEQRLGLIDAVYLNCCSTPCGAIQVLPVRWAGDMPVMKTLALVNGEIKRTGEKLEFVAKSIETVAPAGATAK